MLSGVRILDLTRVLAGPLCTMMLGDLGADVLKVERPDGGDETRGWGPPFDDRGESAYYLSVNRNKKSIALDINRESDFAILRSLIDGADVVVDNFRVGTLEVRGMDPASEVQRRGDLVWCTITGFGAASRRPGYDFVIQAEQGWMAISGEPDGTPMRSGVALADVIAGKDAAIAILAALAAVARGRGGRHCVISLAHSAAAALVNVAQGVLVSGADAARWGNAHPNLVPYQTFEAADRVLVVAVGSDAQWRAFAQVLGVPGLAENPRYETNAMRVRERADLVPIVTRRIGERTAADWIVPLNQAGVPCGVVRTVMESLREVDASALTGIAPSVPGSVRRPPPLLDEHGAAIRSLGWAAFDRDGVESL